MRIGAHVPVAGGLLNACEYAVETGCECLQVFAKSPRQWQAGHREAADTAAFTAECARLGLGPVFTHAAYLINLGSDDPYLWERSCDAMADELVRGAQLDVAGVVVHAGTTYAGVNATPAGRVAEAVGRAWRIAAEQCAPPRLLLENSAGAGRSFGCTVEDLCEAASGARDTGADVGICFDTCHGFAAGIDVSTSEGWNHVCGAVEATLGMEALRLIHANDCNGELGSHRDRHAWIGEGAIGRGGFAAMFAESRLAAASVVLEMPGDPPEKDRLNIEVLRVLRGGGGAPA